MTVAVRQPLQCSGEGGQRCGWEAINHPEVTYARTAADPAVHGAPCTETLATPHGCPRLSVAAPTTPRGKAQESAGGGQHIHAVCITLTSSALLPASGVWRCDASLRCLPLPVLGPARAPSPTRRPEAQSPVCPARPPTLAPRPLCVPTCACACACTAWSRRRSAPGSRSTLQTSRSGTGSSHTWKVGDADGSVRCGTACDDDVPCGQALRRRQGGGVWRHVRVRPASGQGQTCSSGKTAGHELRVHEGHCSGGRGGLRQTRGSRVGKGHMQEVLQHHGTHTHTRQGPA